jgi:hypothetical protein
MNGSTLDIISSIPESSYEFDLIASSPTRIFGYDSIYKAIRVWNATDYSYLGFLNSGGISRCKIAGEVRNLSKSYFVCISDYFTMTLMDVSSLVPFPEIMQTNRYVGPHVAYKASFVANGSMFAVAGQGIYQLLRESSNSLIFFSAPDWTLTCSSIASMSSYIYIGCSFGRIYIFDWTILKFIGSATYQNEQEGINDLQIDYENVSLLAATSAGSVPVWTIAARNGSLTFSSKLERFRKLG